LEDPQRLFLVLRGLWNYSLGRAELQTTHALGEQLLTLAQQSQDSAMRVAAHRALWTTLCNLESVASAQAHYAQGLALYDQQHRVYTFLHGDDSGVMCHSFVHWTLWYLGHPDQWLVRNQEVVTLAQQSALPFSLGFALCWAAAYSFLIALPYFPIM